jgi:signal transduction histidine kinase
MEILALYTSPETLGTALAAGARHLAATLGGFALVYRREASAIEPDGWAGFTCAKDAQLAGGELESFRIQTFGSERPLRCGAPREPERVWSRAAGGVFGFPLRQGDATRGVAIIGCPGPWPRMLNAEIESILRQITLVLDHHDVTETKAAAEEPSEELLQMSEQLLAQDIEIIKQEERLGQVERLKNDLIEKMSHELRNPLNSIIERVISVLAGEHENLSEGSREALREALDEGNSLLRTLQNILDLWRVRQNAVEVQLSDVSLSEVVEEAIFNVRDTVRPDVQLETNVPSVLPKVRTDLGKLNQVLFHLLDNAAKFTHAGQIELELTVEEGQLLCTITDSGVGIAAEDRGEIFDEFFMVDQSVDCKHRGAGLGLTLTRALVEQLGGAISLSSELSHGTRVSFTLPVGVS